MNGFIESLNISTSPHVNAAIILFVFAVIAKAADLLVDKVLRKFTRFTKTDVDDRIIDLIHRPILFAVLAAGLHYSIAYLQPSPKVLFYSAGFIYSILTVIWCVTLIRVSNEIIEHAVNKVADVTGMGKDIVPLTESIVKVVIVIASVGVILSLWKINITPLLASAGIAGAAVAFAAKDTVANLFGGISIFLDKPFKIGDYVVLDQGERGEVVTIGMRSTRIKTRDDILITIPNSIIANTKIINESAPVPQFRVRVPVSVAYGSDIDLVQRTLVDLAVENENVYEDPEPRVRFRTYGDSSLNFELLCWAREPALRGKTIHDLNCSIYTKFAELGIRIPFPQRDVHLFRETDGP